MEDQPVKVPQVNMKQVIYDKSPMVAKLLPWFVMRYIRRIIHEDYINEFLRKHGNKQGLDFIAAVIEDFGVTTKVIGSENLASEGRYIFAGNHPLGGFDGMVLMDYLGKRYHSIRFLVNDILMNLKNLDPLFIPLNHYGPNSRISAIKVDEALRSDSQILTFPAGLVSRKIHGKIVDLEWKKNFIHKAIQYQRDIIPVHTSGRNTEWFYFLANFRKSLRIPWNLETFYLPDETYRHRNKTITISFGKPISYTTFDRSRTMKEWAAWVRNEVYRLPAEQGV